MNNLLKNKVIFSTAAIAVLTLGLSSAIAATQKCASSYTFNSFWQTTCQLDSGSSFNITGLPSQNPGSNLTVAFQFSGKQASSGVSLRGQGPGFVFSVNSGACTIQGTDYASCDVPTRGSFNYQVQKDKSYSLTITNQSSAPITVQRN